MGEPSGFPIILLHGFPYDIRSFDGVVPPLVEAGYRVLVPYLRGYGATHFLDPNAPRMAEQAAIGQDVVDFAGALRIEQCALTGFDWGLRAACITSILHPEMVTGFVAIGGYSVQNTIDKAEPASRDSSRENVVPVVLQHRAGPRRSGTKPEGHRQTPLGDLGADLDLYRRSVQPVRSVLR